MPDNNGRGRATTALALAFVFAALAPVSASTAPEVVLSEGTNLAVHVSPADGRIAMDLLGSLWLLPPRGGEALHLVDDAAEAMRPRWSPDGTSILYQATRPDGAELRLYDLAAAGTRTLGDGRHYDQHGAWHPEGERVVFSSARRGTGFDLWEQDLATGVSWRLTDTAGDVTEPAWSPDGRRLAWIHGDGATWRLMLRGVGRESGIPLVTAEEPLAAPSWRPDGSLITFLRRVDGRWRLDIVILSDPPVVRTIADDQDFFLSPAAWVNRSRFLYTADGLIKSRSINDWGASPVPFRATVTLPESGAAATAVRPPLPLSGAPAERTVVRAARLFDGLSAGYREDVDIVIENGVIAAIEAQRDRGDPTVLELPGATVLPGLIDVYARLGADDPRRAGRRLLAFGVTTIVADAPQAHDADAWETEETPGPRLLRSAPLAAAGEPQAPGRWALVTVPAGSRLGEQERARVRAWQGLGVPVLAETWGAGERLGADLSPGRERLPASPRGKRYQDLALTAGGGPVTRISGLADAATPGMDALLGSRQAALLGTTPRPGRRYAAPPVLYGSPTSVVAGSKPNGLPAGIALHAELRALVAAGLTPAEALQAATVNAARALGAPFDIGRVAPAARADLLLVRGDPLARIDDVLAVIAVIRNGRFYSLVRLLEEAAAID